MTPTIPESKTLQGGVVAALCGLVYAWAPVLGLDDVAITAATATIGALAALYALYGLRQAATAPNSSEE